MMNMCCKFQNPQFVAYLSKKIKGNVIKLSYFSKRSKKGKQIKNSKKLTRLAMPSDSVPIKEQSARSLL